VLSATATAPTLAEARDAAYCIVRSIELPGGQYRTDIAARAIDGQVAVPLG
jgi:phosphoribosylamine--glycine ligase